MQASLEPKMRLTARAEVSLQDVTSLKHLRSSGSNINLFARKTVVFILVYYGSKLWPTWLRPLPALGCWEQEVWHIGNGKAWQMPSNCKQVSSTQPLQSSKSGLHDLVSDGWWLGLLTQLVLGQIRAFWNFGHCTKYFLFKDLVVGAILWWLWEKKLEPKNQKEKFWDWVF